MNSNDLDILIPFFGPASRLVRVLDSVRQNTEINYRLILVLDACGVDVTATAKVWLQENHEGKPALLAVNSSYQGLSKTLQSAVTLANRTRREYVAVIHPEIDLADREWVSKMTLPFKDTSCFMSFADIYAQPNSERPRAVLRTVQPSPGLLLLRRPSPDDISTTDPSNPWMHSAKRVHADGRRIYVVPSVRTSVNQIATPKVKRLGDEAKLQMVVDR